MGSIRFIASGCCSAFGNFGPGDTFTGPEDLCRHLVEEANAAVWVDPPKEEEKPKEEPKRKGRK